MNRTVSLQKAILIGGVLIFVFVFISFCSGFLASDAIRQDISDNRVRHEIQKKIKIGRPFKLHNSNITIIPYDEDTVRAYEKGYENF